MPYSNRDLKISIKLKREDEVCQASYDAQHAHFEFKKLQSAQGNNSYDRLTLDVERNNLKRSLHQLATNFPELLKIWSFMREYETC